MSKVWESGKTAESTDSEVMRAEKLAKTYAEGKLRTPVFDGLDLSVQAGETVAIVGASGAGKSTLLHLLGGLDTPTAGEVLCRRAEDVRALRRRARRSCATVRSASSTSSTTCCPNSPRWRT